MVRPSQRHFAPENLDPRLRAGLVGHWIGGGSGLTWFDRSGYGHHGVVSGALWTLGPQGRGAAMYFDGVDDYVQVAASNSGPLAKVGTGDFTIEMWAETSAASGYHFFLANWNSTGLLLGMVGGDKFGGYFGDGVERASTYTIPRDGSWHHYAVTRVGSDVSFFVDGVACGVVSPGANSMAAANPTYIGTRHGIFQSWGGRIAPPSIRTRALSQSEVSLLAQPSFLPVVPRRWTSAPGPNTITTDATAASATWVAPAATARLRLTAQATAAVSTWFAPSATEPLGSRSCCPAPLCCAS